MLCCTNRPHFAKWVAWNYAKQSGPVERELVLVEGPPEGGTLTADRQRALELATGSHIAWFDDDDWQHPQRLELSLAIATGTAPRGDSLTGSRRTFYFDIRTQRCEPYAGEDLIFNSLLVPVELARSVPSDLEGSAWRFSLLENNRKRVQPFGVSPHRDPLLFVYLIHGRNILNRSPNCRHGLGELAQQMPDWAESTRLIRELELYR